MPKKEKPSNIAALYEDFKSVAEIQSRIRELEKLNIDQVKIIEKLQKEIQLRDEKLKQVEHLLVQTNPVIINITPEEEICEIQIERLRNRAAQQDLTLEEVRKLDLFIKNKRLAQDQSTINVEAKRLETISEAELLQIAGSFDDNSDKS